MLNKGKVLISYVSVLAILAVSILSVFSGGFLGVFAEDGTTESEPTVTYPVNGKYDAGVKTSTSSATYEAVDYTKKTVIDKFTGFDVDFCIDPETEGDGGAGSPFIIKTANQFAAVVTGNLYSGVDSNGNPTGYVDTKGLSFKIADNIRGFNLSNTDSTVNFDAADMTAEKVETALKDAKVDESLKWKSVKPFNGHFDGNGAYVFGLKADDTHAGIFTHVVEPVEIINLTVKNCYFIGNTASAFIPYVDATGKSSTVNASHTFINCSA